MLTCPACQFENMSQSLTCGRCGAKLVWDGPTDPDQFQPPRAGWVKLFYPILYYLILKIPSLDKPVLFIHRLPGDRMTAILLSIIPGLGHYYLNEKTQGRRWLTWWLMPLMAAAVIYLALPSLFLTLLPLLWAALMLIHGLVMISIARPRLYCQSNRQALVFYLILLGTVFILYLTLGFIIQSNVTIKDPVFFRWTD